MSDSDEDQTHAFQILRDSPTGQGRSRITEHAGEKGTMPFGFDDQQQVLDRHAGVGQPVRDPPILDSFEPWPLFVGLTVSIGVTRGIDENDNDRRGVEDTWLASGPPVEGSQIFEGSGDVRAYEEVKSL